MFQKSRQSEEAREKGVSRQKSKERSPARKGKSRFQQRDKCFKNPRKGPPPEGKSCFAHNPFRARANTSVGTKRGPPFIGGRQQQKSAVRHRKLFQKFNVDSRKTKRVQQGKDRRRRRRAKVVSRNRFRARAQTLQPTPTDELQSNERGALLRNSSPPAVGTTVIQPVPARIPRIPRFGTLPRPGHVTNFHENT